MADATRGLLASLDAAPSKAERRAIVDKVCDYAEQEGLMDAEMLDVVSAMGGINDDMEARRLIKSLVPQGKVPDVVVVKLLGQISSSARGLGFKTAALKWITMVLDLIADGGSHLSCYGVYFSLLDYESLQPYICHILARISRRENVKAFRCRRLMSLSAKYGHPAELVELLFVYRSLQPQMITIELPKRKPNPPRVPQDAAFMTLLRRLHPTEIAPAPARAAFGARQRRQRAAPVLTVSAINSYEDVLSNLESKSFAEQMAAILDNKWLALLFSCRADQTMVMRLAYWLQHSLSDAAFRLDHNARSNDTLLALLDRAVDLCESMQEPLPSLHDFLARFLPTWDGERLRSHVFRLVSLLPPMSFEELDGAVLRPLQRLFASASQRWKADLLRAYTRLLHRWSSYDWRRHYDGSERPIMLKETPTNVDHVRTIALFVAYVDTLCTLGLSVERSHVMLQHSALHFYETASLFSKRYDVAMVTPPSPGIFYHCLLGDSPMALARICALISRYHETFSDLKKQSGDRSDVFSFENYKPSRGFTNGLENSRLLNGYIIDMSSSLWVTVKLNRQKEQDISLADYIKTRRYDLSLTHSSSLISFTYAFCRRENIEIEDLAGLMHERLKTDPARAMFRHHLLDYLAGESLGSIKGFLTTFIRRA